jgi:hypothetical protein
MKTKRGQNGKARITLSRRERGVGAEVTPTPGVLAKESAAVENKGQELQKEGKRVQESAST